MRRKSLVLLISSRVLSPKIFVSGLWSVTTKRSWQPCVKYRVCSNPQAMARASPSTAAYRVSAPDRNRDPASVILHPSGQQSGLSEEHEQCFCRRKYPIPRTDQSGRRHVGLVMSNISTPLRMASTITSLDSLNALSRTGLQKNWYFGLRNGLNRAIVSLNWA